MDNKEVFNKAEFAALLDKAKGDRSINQYANETGVSAAHISRFLRKMIEAPPTPETISKLAAKAYNEVTYEDLMIAAGHLAGQYDSNIYLRKISPGFRTPSITKNSPLNYRIEMDHLRKRFIQIILADLYDKSFKWSPEKLEGKKSFPDMILDIEDSKYKRWCFDFKPTFNDKSYMPSINFIFVYGRIATEKFAPTDKITIVVNNERAFASFFKRPPLSLRANLYVMLLNLEKDEIVKEKILCTYE